MTAPDARWTLELYRNATGRCPYETFIGSLDDATFAALDAGVEYVLVRNGMELCRTEWMKALGEGLYEFRIRHDAPEISARFAGEASAAPPTKVPILLRVFCHFHGNKIVLLLSGYDKGQRSLTEAAAEGDRESAHEPHGVAGTAQARGRTAEARPVTYPVDSVWGTSHTERRRGEWP